MSGAAVYTPSLSAWNSNNVTPHVRRAAALAFGFCFSNSGGVLATWLFGTLSPAPEYKSATLTLLVLSIALIVVCGVNMAYLSHQNRRKEKIRLVMTKEQEEQGLGDKSAWFVYNL
jgi:hypothetical protein